MLAANHIVVSGVVGSYIGNPFLAFLVGIIIHFILDAVPHYDTTDDGDFTFRQYALIFADFFIGLLIVFFILHIKITIGSPFIWGAIGGNLPDLFDNIPFWKEKFRATKFGGKIHYFHEVIHSQYFEHHFVLGTLSSYAIIGLFVWAYLIKWSS